MSSFEEPSVKELEGANVFVSTNGVLSVEKVVSWWHSIVTKPPWCLSGAKYKGEISESLISSVNILDSARPTKHIGSDGLSI